MTRSERLAKEGKVEVYIGNIAVAEVMTKAEMHRKARANEIRYIGTDTAANQV